MKLPRILLVTLLFAGLSGGCTTVHRVGDSVESGARRVGRTTGNFFSGIFGGKKKETSRPPRSRSRRGSSSPSTSENPPALESTPQEYVGS